MSVFALLWLVALPLPVAGQTPPAIIGMVFDPTGAGVAGARVTLDCGGARSEIRAGTDGGFSFAGVTGSRCEVHAALEPFVPAFETLDLTAGPVTGLQLLLTLAISSEVVVTPARGEPEALFRVPEAVSVTDREEIERRTTRILPEALRGPPGVLIQQSSTGQGSSFIRGLSAQRVVYLLDGIRFSTSTFRARATQYLAWIDPGFVDRVEVLRGPSSMQYGSDALGGSLNVLTRSPRLSPDAVRASGVVDLAVRGADRGSVAGAVIDVAGPHAALSAGATARGSRELRTGRGTDSRAAVTRFVGLPSTVLYTRLPRTDYGQTSGRLAGVVGVGDGELPAHGAARCQPVPPGAGWGRAASKRVRAATSRRGQPQVSRRPGRTADQPHRRFLVQSATGRSSRAGPAVHTG